MQPMWFGAQKHQFENPVPKKVSHQKFIRTVKKAAFDQMLTLISTMVAPTNIPQQWEIGLVLNVVLASHCASSTPLNRI